MIQATIAKLSIAIAPKRLHVSFNRNRKRVRGIGSLRTLKKFCEIAHKKGIPYSQITRENAGYKVIAGGDIGREIFI